MASLRDWLRDKGMTMEECGEKLGVRQSIVSRLCANKHEPRAVTARNIVVMTKGEVTANELLKIPKKFWRG